MAGGGNGPCSSCCSTCFNRARYIVRNRQRLSLASTGTEADMQVWDGHSGPYLQQVMPGWKPRATWCQTALWLLLLALLNGGLACVSFLCWSASTEVSLDFTTCTDSPGQTCEMRLELKSDLNESVYLYYEMSGAYFNHRRIQTGWSMPQMLGLPPSGNLSYKCRDHTYRDGKLVLPCGALPNAIFNDTVQILGPISDNYTHNYTLANSTIPAVSMSSEGINWPSIASGLYHRPLSEQQFADTVAPISWPKPAQERYRRPFTDAEDLHMWMRTPAFTEFRKMSHRLPEGISAGRYIVLIGYNYPVRGFGGSKRFIIADKTLMGGKNFAMLLLFAVTCGCYLFAAFATFIGGQLQRRKRPQNID